MIIVSNASPLASLSAVGLLDPLPKLYERVLVPDAVWQEAVNQGPTNQASMNCETPLGSNVGRQQAISLITELLPTLTG